MGALLCYLGEAVSLSEADSSLVVSRIFITADRCPVLYEVELFQALKTLSTKGGQEQNEARRPFRTLYAMVR